MILKTNAEKLELKPCPKCGWADPPEWYAAKSRHILKGICSDHDTAYDPMYYQHLKIKGKWYHFKQKWVSIILSFIKIDEGLMLSGSMDWPIPTRIVNETELLAFLKTRGVKDKDLERYFEPKHLEKMRSRVLKEMIHPKGKR